MNKTTSLKDITLLTLVDQIQALPPILKEKVLGISLEMVKDQLREEIEAEIYDEMRDRLPGIVTEEVACKRSRISYDVHSDDELVNVGERIAEQVVLSDFNSWRNQQMGGGHPRDYDYDYSSDTDYDYPDEPDDPDSEEALF